ncbi:MAG: hypothetical protein AAB546_02980 [Patescibacteria group bacterium]
MTDTLSELETKNNQVASKTVSRRGFLNVLFKGGLGLTALGGLAHLSKDIWQPEVVNLGIETLRNPKTIETALSQSASLLETIATKDERAPGAPAISRNPSYRPMGEIISEAIDNYQKKGNRVTFKHVDGYKDTDYYIDRMQEIASDNRNPELGKYDTQSEVVIKKLLGIDPKAFSRAVINDPNFFPPGVSEIWNSSIYYFSSTTEIIIPGSGFEERINEESQIDNGISTEEVILGYIQDIRKHVELLVTNGGQPISAGEIFEYCLNRDEGSIDMSLRDTMIFLKYMARNDISLTSLDPTTFLSLGKSQENEDWFKENILDEYGKVGNYQTLPHETYPYNGLLSKYESVANTSVDKDLHLLNQIGKPYHAWNLALLTVAMPPPIAQMGLAWHAGLLFSEHGPVKIAADFRAALELKDISAKFVQYQNT